MAFSAVVFDLDGTLIDSAGDIQLIVNEILAEIGRPPLSLPAVTGMIGEGPRKLLERALAASGAADTHVDPLLPRFLSRYEAAPLRHTRAYAGVPEVLERLRQEGARLAICTNKPAGATRAVLTQLGLAPLFSVVIGSGSLPGIQKPDRRVLDAALAALGVPHAAAVMVGDAAPDVAVARAAGIPVVLRAGGYTREPAHALGADAVFTHYHELPGVLAGLRRRFA